MLKLHFIGPSLNIASSRYPLVNLGLYLKFMGYIRSMEPRSRYMDEGFHHSIGKLSFVLNYGYTGYRARKVHQVVYNHNIDLTIINNLVHHSIHQYFLRMLTSFLLQKR